MQDHPATGRDSAQHWICPSSQALRESGNEGGNFDSVNSANLTRRPRNLGNVDSFEESGSFVERRPRPLVDRGRSPLGRWAFFFFWHANLGKGSQPGAW